MRDINILIIENESLVALELSSTIKSFGYQNVAYATNIKMSQKYLKEKRFDLILMDINLNETIDGITLYQELQTDTPIIYLTAYTDEATIHRAIKTNPLGYLIKPHNDDELKALLLLATQKISTTQPSLQAPNTIALGEGYYFDPEEEKLFYNNLFIHLGKKELALLKLLIYAKNNPVSYYQIEEEIWGAKGVSNSTIRTLIYRLRGKLEHKLIQSENSYGIKLTLPSLAAL